MNERTHIPPIRPENNAAGVVFSGDSDVSPARQENQDYMAVAVAHGAVLAILADGMGGQSGGFEASRIACNEVKQFFLRNGGHLPPQDLLEQAICAAHARIQEVVDVSPQMKGMGTTIVVALFQGGLCHVAHVGDSRAYVVRDDTAQLVTLDHSRVNRMVVEGMIQPSQAADHPMGHILERALGASPTIEVDVRDEPIVLQRGDRVALCSDGVWAAMNDRLLGQVVWRGDTVLDASRGCVDAALQNKTEDNATAVIIEVTEGAKRAPLPPDVRVLAGILEEEGAPQATTRRPIPGMGPSTPWWLVVAVALAAVGIAAGIARFAFDAPPTDTDPEAGSSVPPVTNPTAPDVPRSTAPDRVQERTTPETRKEAPKARELRKNKVEQAAPNPEDTLKKPNDEGAQNGEDKAEVDNTAPPHPVPPKAPEGETRKPAE